MDHIPAKCGNCGYLFPSGWSFGPGETGVEAIMTVQSGSVSTPCPMCGRKMARLLGGEYKFVQDTITLLSGPESTKEELQRLTTFFKQLKGPITIEEIQEKADQETPRLGSLVRELLAKKPRGVKLEVWLPLIAAIINAVVALMNVVETEKPKPSQVIYEINNNIVQYPLPMGEDQYIVGKIGRNDPCPCGSGRKFKKCCGGTDIIQLQP